ncbi:MAG: hypothetical protein AAGF94_04690 [Pseudomonadota bacterium]
MCYGLRVDFRGRPFPASIALWALADEMREVRTICDCGEKTTMVVRGYAYILTPHHGA